MPMRAYGENSSVLQRRSHAAADHIFFQRLILFF
jgi:hypothetical protein